jgi:hypothetical protein
VRCVIRNRGLPDLRTYSHWILEDISRRSGAYSPDPIVPDVVIPTSKAELEAVGVDVGAIGFHAPRTETKTDDVDTDSEGEDNSVQSRLDSDDNDSDVSSESSNDDEVDGTDLRPVDLTELKRNIGGDGPHAHTLHGPGVQYC